LKWAGGKRLLLAALKNYLPKGAGGYVYYEPFVGAGAVFFAPGPEKAVVKEVAIKNRKDWTGAITMLVM
jgi:DNA adenine methylase